VQKDIVSVMKKLTKEWLKSLSDQYNVSFKSEKNKQILDGKRIGIRGATGGMYGIRDTKVTEYDYLIFCITTEEELVRIDDIQFVLLNQNEVINLKKDLNGSDKSFKLEKFHPFMTFDTFESKFKEYFAFQIDYYTDESEVLNSHIAESLLEDERYTEGEKRLATHYITERNAKVVKKAKEQFAIEHAGQLFCDICEMNYEEVYGVIGKGYIEAHHKNQLSISGITDTQTEDLALLCASCHRMIHKLMRQDEYASYEMLKRKIQSSLKTPYRY